MQTQLQEIRWCEIKTEMGRGEGEFKLCSWFHSPIELHEPYVLVGT